MSKCEWKNGNYIVSTEYARLDFELIHRELSRSYLSPGVPREVIERGKGLGNWLVQCVSAHPALQGLRRMMLATRDAHDLYKKNGWEKISEPDRFMQRHFPNLYSQV